MHGMQEVSGSIPLGSTKFSHYDVVFARLLLSALHLTPLISPLRSPAEGRMRGLFQIGLRGAPSHRSSNLPSNGMAVVSSHYRRNCVADQGAPTFRVCARIRACRGVSYDGSPVWLGVLSALAAHDLRGGRWHTGADFRAFDTPANVQGLSHLSYRPSSLMDKNGGFGIYRMTSPRARSRFERYQTF